MSVLVNSSDTCSTQVRGEMIMKAEKFMNVQKLLGPGSTHAFPAVCAESKQAGDAWLGRV